ncbi:protein TASOR-like isoform X2 [Anabas testudineus]|uniref:protein TASOR-like isoform X2 n=1 Tax=Anabas testudineus TaxID=64144 RepID=UPI000E456ECC|nr:protein TASOR-like isoform X2 [Anabas testudineus]
MNDGLVRREAARPRRASAAAELGANASLQDGEGIEVHPPRETPSGPDRPGAAAGRTERRYSASQMVHHRHMPMEPLKFHIPRKTKEKRALFQYVSSESREYEDMLNILTSSYIDTSSAGCFTYCQPRLVHSELQEKEFVEKRREMKADGRTDKELEESYCFLLADAVKLHPLCEKGLFVGQSWITVLGNPGKGVYLSRYSDLLQVNAFTPGATGEIIILKVMKGKVKSIYENMKNLLDPTPRFDSHISKNASKVTSLTSYRAFELTQQYFYEYSFDELRQRPRQVCPYAVVSFHFKGKDSPLPIKPLAPIRLNSQSAEGSKERAQYTVWTGDLVKGDRVLFQISLRSFSPPFLPHRLPEKLEIGCLMKLDQVTKLVPSELLSYNLYDSSQEVVTNGYCCSLLEVIDRNRSTTSVTRLLHELEITRVVLVTRLTERGFLFLLSSVQMATPTERGENWKRCLQALFVFPDTRDVAKYSSSCASRSHDASRVSMSSATVMPQLEQFIPALHHALVKARANPPPELSAGVELQVREYLSGLNDGKVRQYPMSEYDSKLDEGGKMFLAPRHHKVNMDGYLRSYLYSPTLYLLSVARARQVMEAHCSSEELQEMRLRGQREATGKDVTSNSKEGQTNTQKMQQLIDLVLTCKRNAENEVRREEGDGWLKTPGRKRRLEQETAERTLKYLKASQEPGRHDKIPVEGSQVSAPSDSLASLIGSVGLKDIDLSEDGSDLAARLLSLLTGLSQAARGTASQSPSEGQEDGQREMSPFDKLATKLGLPTNCDIDLRKQEELEEQTAGSMSSLEGFSPSSHSGETNHHGAVRGGGGRAGPGRRTGGYEEEGEEEWQIPWVLIPITGLCSERYTHRDRNIPQDPRFQHLATATSITTTTETPRRSPTPSPQPSPPPSPSPFQCPSPEPSPPPSPSQCPSPDPSPSPSPSQCPSPEPSLPASPSRCLSPGSSPQTSPSQCPSPQPSPPTSPSQCPSPPSPSHCQSPKPNELNALNKDHSGANEERLAPTVSREFSVSMDRKGKPQKNEEPCVPAAPERKTCPSPPDPERGKENALGEPGLVKDVHRELLRKLKPSEDSKDVNQNRKQVVATIHKVASEKEQKGQAKELAGESVFPSSVSSPPAFSVRDIDSIVDKHLDDFSSEIQLLLQEQSVHYSFPQSPHSTSNTETTELQHVHPHNSISQFSQYVSFYNPCPPVQDYVHSLKTSINSMLTEFERWPSRNADTSQTEADATLASTVSAFVAGIRAGNATTDEDEVSASSELTTADVSASGSQSPDATNSRNPPTSHATLSVPTSVSGSACSTAQPHPPHIKSLQSQWQPQQSHTLEINRTVTQNVRQTQDNSTIRTGVETGSITAASNCDRTLLGFGVTSKHLAEPVSSSVSVSVSGTGLGHAPPPTDLSSLISQLQPEVFSNLVEIIKDVKRNSLLFYLHHTEPEDQFYQDVKQHLLKQGNTEQDPVAFLNQENSENRLLVIIKNKDIAGHIHKIPGLVSLKRHPSVVFVGIDTLDDIRNNSYIELFVSGGCIISDELVLSPDFITHDRLGALLMFLDQHSSPESVWKWKVHCKTHKKLKEQARFRRDAANLLDVLSAYQKRQIVEFLPYHHCDMMNQHSPDLNCLIELQGRYTQYRHTLFLTEQRFEKLAAYSDSGFIVAGIEEILHDFTRLVGYHDIKDKQPIMDDLLAPKEHIHPLSSCDQPQQPGSRLPSLPHLSDQLVPDDSCKESSQHSNTDYEVLRQAISQFRAERQAQKEQKQLLDSQVDCSINPLLQNLLSNSVGVGSGLVTPPLVQGGPNESAQLTPGRKAVAATLELIHSALQPELGDQERREDRVTPPTQRQRKAGGGGAETGDQRGGTPVKVVGLLRGSSGTSIRETSPPFSNQNTAVVTGPSNQPDSTSDGTEKVDPHGEPAFPNTVNHGAAASSTSTCPIGGDRSRDTHSGQEQPKKPEGAPPGNSTASSTTLTGCITTVTDQDDNPNRALPRLQQAQQQQHVQHINNQHQHLPPRLSHPQHPPQQQWGVGILQPPHLARLPSQPFSSGHMLGPLTTLGGIRSILGPTPVWTGGLGPPGAATLVWGFPQAGTGASLMGGYHNPAGQGNSRYRGGQRGGGFNGM